MGHKVGAVTPGSVTGIQGQAVKGKVTCRAVTQGITRRIGSNPVLLLVPLPPY